MVRHLDLRDAVAIYAGIILGSGVFLAPSAVAGATASPSGAILIWLAGAIVAGCGAACYAECAGRMPHNGGFFAFHREVYGPAVAFVGGWVSLLITYPASVAAIALVLAGYATQAAGWDGGERGLAAGALLAAGLLNVAGLRTGPRAQRVLTTVKVAAVLALALGVAAAGRGAISPPVEAPAAMPQAAGWLTAALAMLWSYDGWSDVTLVAGEIREPSRNLGRTVVLGTLLLFAVYAVVQVSVLVALPGGRAAASTRPFADAVTAVLGSGAGRAVSGLVVISTFGAIVGTVLTVSRLAAAMAGSGALPPAVGAVHPVLGTPARAVGLVTAAALVYVASASFREILAYFTFAVWIFYGLTAVALLRLRRRRIGEPVAWRAPLGALPPAVVLASGGVLVTSLVRESPGRAAIGGALLAAGFPVFVVLRRWGVVSRSR